MTRSLVYIIFFALSFPVLAQTPGGMGHHGVGHGEMHHWYETLRDRKGRQCCSGRDCRPTKSRLRQGKIEVMVDGVWAPVPKEKILDETSPDLNAHVCAPLRPHSYPLGFVYCVTLPAGS